MEKFVACFGSFQIHCGNEICLFFFSVFFFVLLTWANLQENTLREDNNGLTQLQNNDIVLS